LRVRFLRPAEAEYLEALRYYTSQSVDLGVAFLDDLDHAPALLPGERSRFGDAHEVAETALVLFIVDLVFACHARLLAVEAVTLVSVDPYDHGFIHFGADDHGGLQFLKFRHDYLPRPA